MKGMVLPQCSNTHAGLQEVAVEVVTATISAQRRKMEKAPLSAVTSR
jgi:hypothetical protein